jgi:hypothetical protein
MVGCALPGETRPHHKSVFDFDEVLPPPCLSLTSSPLQRGMLVAASVFVQIVRDLLRQG